VPENTHWDPGYTAAEVAFLMDARFDSKGILVSSMLPPAAPSQLGPHAGIPVKSTMPDHGSDEGAEGVAVPANAATASKRPKRIFDARADTLDFRDLMYVPTLIEVPSTIPLETYAKFEVPVLDQKSEGACTGFGLATVANYLLRRRAVVPDRAPVSPRMLYELARRYDEWPGEDYSGSSARGAMKGWQKHGICSESDWPYECGESAHWTTTRMAAARSRPLGAYFRVNHQDLIAMHAAIAEVGVLYATAAVHSGWEQVDASGVIPYQQQMLGSHAFAIVAYDAFGFWIQNSWGADWGKGGFAQISYDDWLANGSDVWVARLGAPVQLNEPASYATAHARASGQSAAYSYADLRPHLISVGNDGRPRPGGDYGTTEKEIAAVFEHDIPAFFDRSDKPKRLLLFAHGGLVGEEAAVQRVAEYRSALLAEGVYPLAFIWRSDYLTTVKNILQDAVRRRRPEGFLDSTKDFLLDRLDDALEPVARYLSGKAAWSEMKENALLASSERGAASITLRHVQALKTQYPDLELHVVGHSAGAVFHAPIIQLLCSSGSIATGPAKGMSGMGMVVASCTLWAPACTTDLFKQTYLPAIKSSGIQQFALYCLNDQTEQDDNCAHIYNKSLLYLVSNAFEAEKRIPGFRQGEPLAGLRKSIKADHELEALFSADSGRCELVVSPNDEAPTSRRASKAQHHGDFDNDPQTVMSTFRRILGSGVGGGTLRFASSAATLKSRRNAIDDLTKR
jgi:hypothetical protein